MQDKTTKDKWKQYFGIELKSVSVGSQKYYFQTAIFFGIILLLLGYVVYVMQLNDFDKSQHFYIRCPSNNSICYNTLYQSYPVCSKVSNTFDFCNTEYLPPNFEYGIKPPAVLDFFSIYVFIMLACAFIGNHLMYNRGFSIKKAFKEDGDGKND